MKVRDVVVTALFAALTAAGAQVSLLVPALGPVPFTLQNFVVILSGAILGPKLGALSQVVYLLIGAAGLPVFAGYSGGIGRIAGPTGGYLLSYPLAAFLIGALAGKDRAPYWRTLVAMLAGEVIIFTLGVGQLWFYLSAKQGADVSLSVALVKGLLPFILPDLVKVVAAAAVAQRLRRVLNFSDRSLERGARA